MLKKIALAASLFSLTFSTYSFAENNQIVANSNDVEFEKLEELNSQIYNEHAKGIHQAIEAQMKKMKVESYDELNQSQKDALRETEFNQMEKMKKEIEQNMLKNGWEKVETPDEESDISILSSSFELTLSDGLYYNSQTGYYNFQGFWDWTDWEWDAYHQTTDIAAFRGINEIDRIGNSYSYTYDQYGEQWDYTSKRFEDENGVVFNVDDHTRATNTYDPYKTDNGMISVYFQDSGYNKFFIDFEHNWKTYSWSPTVSISGINLTGTSLSVQYTDTANSFPRTSGGESIN